MMKQKCVSYTADFKLKVIKKATEVGNRETARLFNIDKGHGPIPRSTMSFLEAP
jgi:hypothetical protein